MFENGEKSFTVNLAWRAQCNVAHVSPCAAKEILLFGLIEMFSERGGLLLS